MIKNSNYTSATTVGVIMPTRIVDPFKPFVPDLAEIVQVLPNINRYNGATNRQYSVAEHSINCAIAAMLYHNVFDQKDILAILLHDCAEAYLQDLVRPIKQYIGDDYLEAEDRITQSMYNMLGLSPSNELVELIKEIDTRMAATEINQLLPNHANILTGVEPYQKIKIKEKINHSYADAIWYFLPNIEQLYYAA